MSSRKALVRVRWWAAAAVAAALVLLGWNHWAERQAATPPREAGPSSPGDAGEALDESLIVGTWEDDYKGHRTLTLRPDGTATMVVELEGLSAKLYARRLTFEEQWSVAAGKLTLKTLGGEPKRRVHMVLQTMGDTAEHEILELTSEQMLLLDADGSTRFDWRRVP